jgi:hypothetical protein
MSLFDGAIAFGDETSFGLEVARTRFLPMISDTVKPRRIAIENKGRRAGSRFPPASTFSVQGAEGSIEWVPETNGLAFMLKHMLGTLVTSAGVVGGTWNHVATPGDPTGKSLTLEANRPFANGAAATFVASGGKVKSWGLGMDLNGMLTAKADLTFANWRQDALTRDTTTVSASTSVTVASTAGITAGQRVVGTGIPANATVASITNATTLVLSAAATASGTVPVTYGLDAQHVTSGTLTAAGTTVTVASTTGYVAGQPVYGIGIPAGAVIASITNATTFVLSIAATVTGTSELVIGLTPTTPAYLAAEPFPFDKTLTTITYNGAAAVGLDLLGFSLEADMGIVDRQTMGGYKEAVPGANAGIKLAAKIEWEDFSAYRRYNSTRQADTLAGFDITFRGTNPITGSTLPSLRIQIPAVQLEAATPDAGEGVLVQELAGMVKIPASGQPITVTALTGSATP